MRAPFGSSVVAVVLLEPLCLGASCSGGQRSSDSGNGSTRPSGERIERIEAVDISDLTASERRIWADLANDLLSPCGQPISVAACASSEANRCRKCVPAARTLVRLVAEGYERNEIEELYNLRFGRDTRVELSTEGVRMRGAPMAVVTIVEFSDFECPYCGAAHPIIKRALRELEGKVRLAFKNFPLDGHVRAMPAARAAVAAGRQGKFWEMHDMLFEHQSALEDEDLERYAREIGLDVDRFRADLASPEVQRSIDADKAEGRRVGVQGTPTIFVNGRQFKEPPQSLLSYLREELDE